MKLGVLAVLLSDLPLKDALAYLKESGAQMVEIGCGGFPGKAHCDPEILLNDEKAFAEFKKTVEESGLEISAFSAHGNAVHPNPEIAAKFHKDFENAVLLAEKMG
ncbi:MAG: sugar phosphate isomerase/epimerase, partial [Clostridia bacterium]|nr:sugar phosphate isomerase/epimerase [Clostridia bacterium]